MIGMFPCQNSRAEMSHKTVYVIGAGGHAKVVIGTLLALGRTVSGLFDDDPQKWGRIILGVPVLGPIEAAREFSGKGTFVVGIGDNARRKALVENLEDFEWEILIHPRSFVDPSVRVGAGTVVFAGAVVQPEVTLGAHSIVNTGATVDHDCKVSSYVHLAPGVHLAGGVEVGEGAMLGVGSSVLPNVRIGRWSVVGAGAVVIRDLPSHVVAIGVPAKVNKKRLKL